MSATLTAVNGGCFRINQVPYSRSHTLPVFDKIAETVAFINVLDIGRQVLTPHRYDEVIDAATGDPFLSFQDLTVWCESHVFEGANAGAASIPYIFTYNVTDTPVLPNDRLPGDAIIDAALVGYRPQALLISGAQRLAGSFSKADASDTLKLLPGESFANEDKVILFCTIAPTT